MNVAIDIAEYEQHASVYLVEQSRWCGECDHLEILAAYHSQIDAIRAMTKLQEEFTILKTALVNASQFQSNWLANSRQPKLIQEATELYLKERFPSLKEEDVKRYSPQFHPYLERLTYRIIKMKVQ